MPFPTSPSDGATHSVGPTNFVYNLAKKQWIGTTASAPTGGGSSASTVSISSTPPSSPSAGQLWFDDSLGKLFIWNSSVWIDASPR